MAGLNAELVALERNQTHVNVISGSHINAGGYLSCRYCTRISTAYVRNYKLVGNIERKCSFKHANDISGLVYAKAI